jgi:hypothetical protein
MATARTRPDATETQREALAKLKRDGRRDKVRAKLARVYWHARKSGIRLSGRRCTALTDKEAAELLGVSVSTICARRNELMGGSGAPEPYEQCAIVEEAGRRHSRVDDRGMKVTCYRFRNSLFLAFDE